MKTKIYYGDCGHELTHLEGRLFLGKTVPCTECGDDATIDKITTEERREQKNPTDLLDDKCPKCGSEHIGEEQEVDVGGEGGEVWFEKWCNDCDAQWTESYKATYTGWRYV